MKEDARRAFRLPGFSLSARLAPPGNARGARSTSREHKARQSEILGFAAVVDLPGCRAGTHNARAKASGRAIEFGRPSHSAVGAPDVSPAREGGVRRRVRR